MIGRAARKAKETPRAERQTWWREQLRAIRRNRERLAWFYVRVNPLTKGKRGVW